MRGLLTGARALIKGEIKMLKPEAISIEVDMVPMIDIISLLLMFLIVVGGTASNACSIEMKLPRADQASPEKNFRTEGRIVVELAEKDGVYSAVINNKRYALSGVRDNYALEKYLAEQTPANKKDGTLDTPVKLRIPEIAPMHEVEKVIMTLTRAGLVNIQYAAQPRR
jgi:biopolymer transport protein ExbD